jgi:formate-dependent nitrite reductase membrane component NrfD
MTMPALTTPPLPPVPRTPRTRDGRNLDPALGDERGEGALIEVSAPDVAWPVPQDAQPVADHAPVDTYYDLPVVKAPPWKWYVGAYFAIGGLAGAAASLAGATELAGRHIALTRRLRWIAALGDAAGAGLLVADLGRPARFHHMMRVLRPTSPMNVGTWILSAASATSALGMLQTLRDRPAPRLASVASIATGAALSTYTGVLIGNTAVPVWSATRRALPVWFAALSAASLASLLEILDAGESGGSARMVRRYSAIAKVAQLATARSVASAARAAGTDRPLREGRSGALWRGATWLGVASLAATLWPGGGRTRGWLAGALGTAAAVCGRFAMVHAARASAADPRATFEPQRRRALDATSRADHLAP